MALPSAVNLSLGSVCPVFHSERAPGSGYNREVGGTKSGSRARRSLNAVRSAAFEYRVKQRERERRRKKKKKSQIELTSFSLLREHVFTAGFDEHGGVPPLDADKSESHECPRAAEHRRFDLASQGLFFLKAQFKMHIYVGHDDGGRQ